MNQEEAKECPPPTPEELERIAQVKLDEFDHVIAVGTKHFCGVAMEGLSFLVIGEQETPFKVGHTILLQDVDQTQGLTGEEFPVEVTHMAGMGAFTPDNFVVLGIRPHISKSGLMSHAMTELDILYQEDDGDLSAGWLKDGIKELMALFVRQEFGSNEGVAKHVGDVFHKLVNFTPLTPLTGGDDEWRDVSEFGDPSTQFQNKRCSQVMKGPDGLAFDIFARVYIFPDGEVRRDPFEGSKTIEFPYTPPKEIIHLEAGSDEMQAVMDRLGMVGESPEAVRDSMA